MKIHEISFYLKSRYSTDNRNQINFIQNFPSQEDVPSFEVISQDRKKFSKYMKEDENMSLKNKFLFGGWISIVAKAYRHDKIIKGKKFSHQFEDWIYRECKIKKQTILYKLISVAPKLLNCRVSMTNFFRK